MNNLQKIGGLAALYEAAAYLVGIVGFLLIVDVSSAADPVEEVAMIVENQAILAVLHLIVYVAWGVGMVVLSLSLHERLKKGAPALAQTATVFGLIWAALIIASGMIYNIGMETVAALHATDPAQAATVWLAIDSIYTGLGGGNEIVGGIWVLLLSWAALKTGTFSRSFNYFGLVISAAAILTMVPALGEIGGIVFGLGQIVWFVWLGVALLRGTPRAALHPAPAV